MSNCGYVITNLVALTGAGNVGTATADSVYTKASLLDGLINKPYRPTEKTSQYVTVDLGEVLNVTHFSILGHNFTSGATISLESGTTVGYGTTTSLTYAATNIQKTFATLPHQYFKFNFSDVGNAAMPEFCELVIAQIVPFVLNVDNGWQKGEIYENDKQMTLYGSILAYEMFSVRTRRFTFTNKTPALEAQIEAMFQAAKGDKTPLVLVPDPDVNYCLYGRINPIYAAQHVAGGPSNILYGTGFDFKEESAGKTVP